MRCGERGKGCEAEAQVQRPMSKVLTGNLEIGDLMNN